MKKIFGFSLGEIIITLTVLGILAIITLPNLINRVHDKISITKFKVVSSALFNAFDQFLAENGGWNNILWPDETDCWGCNKSAQLLMDELASRMNVSKYCKYGTSNQNDCLFKTKYYTHNNVGKNTYARYQTLNDLVTGNNVSTLSIKGDQKSGMIYLSNGALISIKSFYQIKEHPTRYNGAIQIDINGSKSPNRLGYDVFFLVFDTNGISVNGFLTKKDWNLRFNKKYCKYGGPNDGNNAYDGMACSYWILMKNNMDYKYRDTSNEW